MAVKYTLEVDTRPLDRIVVNAYQLHGEAILFGIPEPAPQHTDSGVTTALTLARVEYGAGMGKPRAKQPKPATIKPSWLGRVRAKVRGLLGSVRRGRPLPKRSPAAKPPAPTDKAGERPVIRWLAAARRDAMVEGFRAAAKQACAGKDPRPDLEVLGDRLVFILRDRLTAVGGVVTGQTRDAISYKIVRRYGPHGGVLSSRAR
jgi:hypothetical protein